MGDKKVNGEIEIEMKIEKERENDVKKKTEICCNVGWENKNRRTR